MEDGMRTCTECGGTGWATLEDSEGRMTARRCRCFASERTLRLLDAARIPTRYRHCEITAFDTFGNSALVSARRTVEGYVADYLLVDYGLLLVGSCGAGKTHLAIGILKDAIRRYGVKGLFIDFRDLLKEIQSSYNEVSRTSEKEVLRPVLNAELLVLDDLGAEKPSAWVHDTLAYIINYRYNNKLRTIITTNFPDNHAEERSAPRGESFTERIGVRLRSRLYEMCKKIEISGGKDYRQEYKAPGLVRPRRPGQAKPS